MRLQDELEDEAFHRYIDCDGPVANSVENLRHLLTGLYVGVLGHLLDAPELQGREEALDALLTSVLDAAEGRSFTPVPLPWPPQAPPRDAEEPSS